MAKLRFKPRPVTTLPLGNVALFGPVANAGKGWRNGLCNLTLGIGREHLLINHFRGPSVKIESMMVGFGVVHPLIEVTTSTF